MCLISDCSSNSLTRLVFDTMGQRRYCMLSDGRKWHAAVA